VVENKRVHDLYCSFIFKCKALCISRGYKMLIDVPGSVWSAPSMHLVIRLLAAMFFC